MESESLRDQFEFSVVLPSRLKNALLWLVTVIYVIILSALFGVITIWPLVLLILVGYGLLMGKFWNWISSKLLETTILKPLRDKHDSDKTLSSLQRFYLRRFLTRGSDRAFLQVSTVDRDISSFKKIGKEFFQPIFSFLAIMLTISQYFLTYQPDLELGPALTLGFIIAFPILGIYLPFSMIIEDARIMNVNLDGSVEFIGGRLRRLIDGFFGVTGIISGYTIALDASGTNEGFVADAIISTFVWVLALIIIIFLSVPILVPTLMTYYSGHAPKVNKFRREAMQLKIYPAKTSTERLTSEEIRKLVIGDAEEGPEETGLLGRIRTFFTGSRTIQTEYTEDQIQDLELHGAWLCENCEHINTAIEKDTSCVKCGTPRVLETEPMTAETGETSEQIDEPTEKMDP